MCSFDIAKIWICRLNIMAKGTFILSAHIPKTEEQKDRVKVRKTGARYAIVIIAILVIFVY
jgi:hypothetical protein